MANQLKYQFIMVLFVNKILQNSSEEAINEKWFFTY